jgi:predicted metal-dependent phosphoesterase TrpH
MIARSRLLTGLAVLVGLALSVTSDSPSDRRPVEGGGYTVLAVDFHVHSFPGDGVLPPWNISLEARRRRLDAVTLTNHNSSHSWRLTQRLSGLVPRTGALLIPGVELTSSGYHMVVAGVTEPLDWRQSAASAVTSAHAAGGVAIAAHPAHRTWKAFDDAALMALDGVEVAHASIHVSDQARRDLPAFYQRALRVHPAIAAIGSSDFHHFAPVGLDRTYVFATAPTQAGILDAVRAGRTVACDGHGNVSGPPALVAMTQDACRRDATAPPDGETPLQRIGTWLVWAGLVALVIVGGEGRR